MLQWTGPKTVDVRAKASLNKLDNQNVTVTSRYLLGELHVFNHLFPWYSSCFCFVFWGVWMVLTPQCLVNLLWTSAFLYDTPWILSLSQSLRQRLIVIKVHLD